MDICADDSYTNVTFPMDIRRDDKYNNVVMSDGCLR
jgi:hypothetical protein